MSKHRHADKPPHVLGKPVDRDAQIRQAAHWVVAAFEHNQLIAETEAAAEHVKTLRAVLRLHAADADKAVAK